MSEFTSDYRWTSPNAKPDWPATVRGLLILRDDTADLLDALDARLRALEARLGADGTASKTAPGIAERESSAEAAPAPASSPARCEGCAYWKSEAKHAESLLAEAETKLAKLREVLDG